MKSFTINAAADLLERDRRTDGRKPPSFAPLRIAMAGNIEAARKLMREDGLGRRIGALDRAFGLAAGRGPLARHRA